MGILRAIGVGVLTGAIGWAIAYGVYLWQVEQLQKSIPAGLGALSEAWTGPAALVGFVIGFIWEIRKMRGGETPSPKIQQKRG